MFAADEITPASISGWAYDPERHVSLDLQVNGLFVTQTLANGFRADLEAARIGGGHVGYTFLLKHPGLSAGDRVQIKNSTSGAMLYDVVVEFSPDALDVASTYEFARQYSTPFSQPFLRASLDDAQAERVCLAGELFIPAGYSGEAEPAVPNASVSITAADCSTANRYWWMDGQVHVLKIVKSLSSERTIVGPPGSSPNKRSLNFGVVPSLLDLQRFIFPGAAKARRVAGGDNTLVRFAGGGLVAALQMLVLFKWHGETTERAHVLDWGCGAARVLQFLSYEKPDWRFNGVDIDTVNVEWCQRTLPNLAQFDLAPLRPPLNFERGTFDFVYGLSVITHLTEPSRAEWLEELGRVLKSGGLCVLTYLSPFHILQAGVSGGTLTVVEELSRRGISDHLQDTSLGDDLKSYYRATYCTVDNIRLAVDPWFEIVGHYPNGALYQDTLALRRK